MAKSNVPVDSIIDRQVVRLLDQKHVSLVRHYVLTPKKIKPLLAKKKIDVSWRSIKASVKTNFKYRDGIHVRIHHLYHAITFDW